MGLHSSVTSYENQQKQRKMYSADPKEIVKTFKKRNEFWYFAFSKFSDVLKIGVASIWPGSIFPCTFLFSCRAWSWQVLMPKFQNLWIWNSKKVQQILLIGGFLPKKKKMVFRRQFGWQHLFHFWGFLGNFQTKKRLRLSRQGLGSKQKPVTFFGIVPIIITQLHWTKTYSRDKVC